MKKKTTPKEHPPTSAPSTKGAVPLPAKKSQNRKSEEGKEQSKILLRPTGRQKRGRREEGILEPEKGVLNHVSRPCEGSNVEGSKSKKREKIRTWIKKKSSPTEGRRKQKGIGGKNQNPKETKSK